MICGTAETGIEEQRDVSDREHELATRHIISANLDSLPMAHGLQKSSSCNLVILAKVAVESAPALAADGGLGVETMDGRARTPVDSAFAMICHCEPGCLEANKEQRRIPSARTSAKITQISGTKLDCGAARHWRRHFEAARRRLAKPSFLFSPTVAFHGRLSLVLISHRRRLSQPTVLGLCICTERANRHNSLTALECVNLSQDACMMMEVVDIVRSLDEY